MIESILDAYGVEYRRILPAQKGYRNHVFPVELLDGGLVSVTVFKREPEIAEIMRRADAVSHHLADQGFPAKKRFDPRTIMLKGSTHTRYAALYQWLPGETIPWEAYTMAHLKSLGKTMSDMHNALQTCVVADLPDVEAVYEATLRRMIRYFSDPNVQRAMQAKLGIQVGVSMLRKYQKIVAACRNLQRRQPLHMDFVRGNILFDGTKDSDGLARISGILDFEKTAVGHPLFDIARTYAFLLVDCKYKTPAQVHKYFLCSGYHKRGKAPLPKIKTGNEPLLQALTTLFLYYDFYKFLRHNPYESLHQNEHFARTKHALLARAALAGQEV